MSLWPDLPTRALYAIQDDSTFTPASEQIPNVINYRARMLARTRGRVSAMWAMHDMPTGGITASGTDEDILGDFILPPCGAPDDTVKVHVYVSTYATTGSLYARVKRLPGLPFSSSRNAQLGTRQTLFSITATGWYSATISTAAFEQGQLLRISAATAGDFTIGSICVLSGTPAIPDGDTVPTSHTKLSLAHCRTEDRPLDVNSLRRASRMTNMVATYYPRTFVSHAFRSHTATEPATVEAFYRVQRGPRTSNCTLRVRAQAGATNGTVEVFTATGGAYTSRGTVTITGGAAEAWYSITISAGWTANTVHEVKVVGTAAAAETLTIREIQLHEVAYTETDLLVTSASRVDGVAPRLYSPAGEDVMPGTPIWASRERTGRNDDFRDRATCVRNALFCAQHLSATLISDRLGQTPGSAASTTTLHTFEHVTGKGETTLELFVLCRRDDILDVTMVPVLVAQLDGVTQDSAWLTFGDGDETPEETTIRKWRKLGSVTVTPGTTHEIKIRGAWQVAGATSKTASSTPLNDTVILEGVVAYALPAEPRQEDQYFYDLDTYTSSNSIPDNDVVTGRSKSIVSTAAHKIDRVRVYVGVTHATPTQLLYKLSDGTVSVTFRAAAHAGATAAWWSDAAGGFIGDTDTDAALSAFIGRSAAATWTLTVYDNAAGTTGTLDSFGLELW